MLLTAELYPSVRAALDISFDEDTIPDAIIEKPIFAGSAELAVEERDPDYLTRTGKARRHIENALILFCAARLAPSVPSLLSEDQGDYSYSRSAVDWNRRAGELAGRAEAELAAVLTPANRTPPIFFAVASATRGQ